MSRRICCTLALILLLATILLAEPGIVRTRDGHTYEGDVREGERTVSVTTRGIETVIERSNIASIEYLADYERDFRERLAKLEASDVKGRLDLAREAFDRRRYDLAREATHDALRIEPNSQEAAEFLEVIERHVRLDQAAGAAPLPPPSGSGPRAPARVPPVERRLLSSEDINIIRQYELREDDTGVRITIPADVRRRFAEQNNIPFAEFNRIPTVQQALRIFENGDPEMRRAVRIGSDPASLAEYKRVVQPVVLSHCASSGCHGGTAGGDFLLYAPADSDPVTYTNFYILAQYQHRAGGARPADAGVFGGSARKMIERGQGERSLLVNYGLPVHIAEYDHPDVGGKPIQPIFRNRQDPRYEPIVNWIDNILSPIAPNYGIDFVLPRATTRPATAPARGE